MRKWIILITVILTVLPFAAHAQEQGTGQFWVRAFEDRDGDGVRDTGEPLITRGLSVELRDASGTIIDSELLEQSANATQGLVGFQYLVPGQYTLIVAAPELTATTPLEFTTTIQDGALPTVVEFGGQRFVAQPTTGANALAATEIEERQEIARLAISGLGALVVVGVMTVIGMLLYGILSRPRLVAQPNAAYYADPRATNEMGHTTSSMRAIRDKDLEE